MGNCAASQITSNNGGLAMTAHHHSSSSSSSSSSSPSTVKVIHVDGRLEEFAGTMKASQLLSQNLNCFLCSSESMFVDAIVPHVHEEEDLHLGQLYFLLPLSMSRAPLSLQDLCLLAVKASAALESGSSLRGRKDGGFSMVGHRRRCRARTGCDTTSLESGHSSQRIEL